MNLQYEYMNCIWGALLTPCARSIRATGQARQAAGEQKTFFELCDLLCFLLNFVLVFRVVCSSVCVSSPFKMPKWWRDMKKRAKRVVPKQPVIPEELAVTAHQARIKVSNNRFFFDNLRPPSSTSPHPTCTSFTQKPKGKRPSRAQRRRNIGNPRQTILRSQFTSNLFRIRIIKRRSDLRIP